MHLKDVRLEGRRRHVHVLLHAVAAAAALVAIVALWLPAHQVVSGGTWEVHGGFETGPTRLLVLVGLLALELACVVVPVWRLALVHTIVAPIALAGLFTLEVQASLRHLLVSSASLIGELVHGVSVLVFAGVALAAAAVDPVQFLRARATGTRAGSTPRVPDPR